MELRNSRILVTGGCGLIGSTTIDHLLRHHAPKEIIVLDDMSRGRVQNLQAHLHDPRLRVVEGDIGDADLVQRLTAQADGVLHLAALRITACAADPRATFEVMARGSFNVVEAAQQCKVQKLVAASSASIYGLAESFPTDEAHHPYANRTWYGACKSFLEGMMRSFHDMHGLDYIGLRYFNVYGPRMDVHGKYTEVLIRWMERIAAGQPPLILGDGSTSMDFIYIDDVARANIAALRSDVCDEIFNIASGEETSLLALADQLSASMHSHLAPVFGPERQVNPVSRRLASTLKAKQMLGFEAQTDLATGLRQLVEWWRAQVASELVHA